MNRRVVIIAVVVAAAVGGGVYYWKQRAANDPQAAFNMWGNVDVHQVELAGSFRRRKETIGDLDVLVTGGDAEKVMQAFTSHDSVADILGHGDTKSSVKLHNGLQVDLRVVPEESFGAALPCNHAFAYWRP